MARVRHCTSNTGCGDSNRGVKAQPTTICKRPSKPQACRGLATHPAMARWRVRSLGRSSSREGKVGWVKLPEVWEPDRMLRLCLEIEGRNTSMGWRKTRERECTNTHWTNLAQRNVGTDRRADGENLRGNAKIYPSDLKSLPKSLGRRRTSLAAPGIHFPEGEQYGMDDSRSSTVT